MRNQPSSQFQRSLVVIASVVIIIAGMRAAGEILAPILLSLVLVITVAPLVGWLRRKRLPNWLACLIIALGVLAVGLATIGVLLSSANDLVRRLPDYQAALEDKGTGIDAWLTRQGIDVPEFGPLVQANARDLAGAGAEFLSILVSSLYGAGLVLFLVVLFLLGASGLSSRLWERTGSETAFFTHFVEFSRGVHQNMLGLSLNNMATALFITIWLMLFRVDFAILWGLLAFFLGYVPNVGMLLAAIPPILLALIQLSPETALIVAVGLIVIIAVLNFITNALIGQAVDVSPAAGFVAFLFWAWVLGPLGTLLAFPLTVALKLALESNKETRGLAALLSSKPPGRGTRR